MESIFKMAILDGQAFLAAIIFIMGIVVVLMIVVLIRSRRGTINDSSTPTNQPCDIAPNTPINLTTSNPQGDLIIFTWGAVSGTQEYVSFISSIPNFTITDSTISRTSVFNTASFANLTVGVTYYLKVKAVNSCGESNLSSEISYRIPYIFPSKFQIKHQQSSTYAVCDTHAQTPGAIGTTDQMKYNRFCLDVEAELFYDDTDKTIRQSSRPSLCMTRFGSGTVYMGTCISATNQQWSYNGQDSYLCSFTDPENGCLVTDGTIDQAEPAMHGPKDALINIENQWDIVQVN